MGRRGRLRKCLGPLGAAHELVHEALEEVGANVRTCGKNGGLGWAYQPGTAEILLGCQNPWPAIYHSGMRIEDLFASVAGWTSAHLGSSRFNWVAAFIRIKKIKDYYMDPGGGRVRRTDRIAAADFIGLLRH